MSSEDSSLQNLVEKREMVKKRKPEFQRQENWRYKRVKENWRKPKGLDSKMRKEVKGWPPRVKVGYRGPKLARNLHPSAFKEVIIHNVDDLNKIDAETEAVKIAHTVGAKKRAEILNRAKDLGIRVLNPKAVEIKEASKA
ncbi:MAG: 50S ribosomal protein L32e [Candidatus Bathyarchaeia archaeon]|nr:50S ribosomal protein L32e [Candidatus Bathyarchaeota archaeon]